MKNIPMTPEFATQKKLSWMVNGVLLHEAVDLADAYIEMGKERTNLIIDALNKLIMIEEMAKVQKELVADVMLIRHTLITFGKYKPGSIMIDLVDEVLKKAGAL